MKKLLYITTNLQGSGGVARVLSVKLDYLIKNYGYTIHVITTNNTSDAFFYEFNKKLIFHKIDIKNFGFHHLLKYKRKLQSLVDNEEPDIIINCDNGFKGVLLPYLINTKASLIYERHVSRQINTTTLIEIFKKNSANYIIDRSLRKYRAFIVLNDENKKDWNANNVKVIQNPICLKTPFEESQLKNKIALAVGRHSTEKQFDVLLKIWQKVVVDYPDWTLKIYGESDEGNSLKKLAEKLNLGKQVEFYPPTKNITDEYHNASMLLNTSSSEAFGLVIIEAMAYGLPVIAFNSASGPKSLINNRKNGLLIESNDVQDYSNNIKVLIQNETLRKTLGENAKESANKFNLDRIMRQWHELFESLK